MKNLASIILLSPLLLIGCGGGGGGGLASNSISGVAASGAPLSGGNIKLTCANGTTRETTADESGNYSFSDLEGCAGPYVITASGLVNGTVESYVSVLPNASISDKQYANATPITHAIAATLASDGDPHSLASNISSEAQNITPSAVSLRKGALSKALADLLSNAGLGTDFDLLSSTFTADNKGFDKVLDNLVVDVKSTGIDITNTGSNVIDDLASLNTRPANDFSTSSISINKNTDFSSSLGTMPGQLLDPNFADTFQSQLNTCFASPAANRGTISNLGASCQAIRISSDYKNDGRTASNEFDGRLQSPLYDGAKFSKPTIVRYLSTAPTDTRAVVDFAILRTDGVPDVITTVVEQSNSTSGVLQMRGNRRPFLIDVSGVAQKRQQIIQRNTTTAKASTFYMTGIQFYLDYNVGRAGSSDASAVKYIHVTGPLLPTTGTGGIWLRRGPTGCDGYFTVWRSSNGNGDAPDNTQTVNNCAAVFQLSSRAVTTNDYDNYATLFGDLVNNPQFASTKLSDADIRAIKPGTAYKFEVFLNSNAGTTTPDYVFYQRLKSRPYTMGTSAAAKDGEIDAVKWSDGLLQSTITEISPPSSTSGLAATLPSLNVSYTRTPNAAPPFKTWVQVKQSNGSGGYNLQVDSANLPIKPDYTYGTVISKDLTNSSAGWNNPQLTTGANTMNFVQLVSRNKYGTILLRDWKY